MIKIPQQLKMQFEALLAQKEIPKRFHSECLKWLRYYLDFCHKYSFEESKKESLPHFIKKLQAKRQTVQQQKRASRAISIYQYPSPNPNPEGLCHSRAILTVYQTFPNLLCVSLLACRHPYPDEPSRCSCLFLHETHQSSPHS